MITVADIMTQKPHIATVDTNLEQALKICQEFRIRHLPVVDKEHHLLGLVSERDLRSAQESSLAKLSKEQRSQHQRSHSLDQIMVTKVHSVNPHASVEDAARHIENHRIGCLPVVEKDKLVGILTDSDFVGVAITLLEMQRDQEPLIPD
ncbi:CBS domain-containing protein [Alginatibacterium sediminis]|nr:CBS domain-containing protein [Alginatibacterium sediminis]